MFFTLLLTVSCLQVTRSVPHLTRADGGFRTELLLGNPSGQIRELTLRAMAANGSALPEHTVTLAPGQTQQHNAHNLLGPEAAYLLIEGDAETQVTAVYEASSPEASPAHLPESVARSRRWRLFRGDWQQVFDGIAFVNVGSHPATVLVTQYGYDGKPIAFQQAASALPSAQKGLFVLGLPEGGPFTPATQDYFEVTADQDLLLTALRGTPPGKSPAYLWENMALPLDEVDIPLPLSEVRSWAYQIQEIHLNASIEELAQSRYDLVVVEPSRTDWSPAEAGLAAAADFDTASAVAQLKRSRASDGFHRKLVLAYIDIGQAEDWRWYWTWAERSPPEEEAAALCAGPFPPPGWPDYIVKCDPDQWLHNYPVRFWDPAWQNVVLQGSGLSSAPHPYVSILDEVLLDGFDGIYLDWVEAFEDEDIRRLAQAEGVSPAEAMVRFLEAMRLYGRARNPQFLVIQQNAASLISESQQATHFIDALAQEAVWFDGEATDNWNDSAGYDQKNDQTLVDYYLGQMTLYQQVGLPVFVCEYALSHAPTAYQNALDHGFIPYVTRRSLSRLTTTPPPPLPAP